LKRLDQDKFIIDVSYFRAGRRCRLRRRVCGSRRAALKWEADIKTSLRLGKFDPSDEKRDVPLFKDFAREWLETYAKANNKLGEQRNKEITLRVHLVPIFGNRRLDQITARDIEGYKAKLVTAGYAPRTVNLHRKCLRKLLQCAVDWDLLEKNPVDKVGRVKEQKDVWQFLDFEESERLLAASPDKWRPLLLCALRTGMRRGELLALRWQDVDFKRRVITVRHSLYMDTLTPTKSYAAREIRMTRDLFEALLSLRHLKGPFVFCQDDGRPLRRAAVRSAFDIARRKAGVKRVRFHDLRHSFASQVAMSGVPIKTLQELLGHSDLKMTQRYAHLTPACREEAICTFERGIASARGQKVDTSVSADAILALPKN